MSRKNSIKKGKSTINLKNHVLTKGLTLLWVQFFLFFNIIFFNSFHNRQLIYNQKTSKSELKDWAVLALYECKMYLESSIGNENQAYISTGLGGKGDRLRYFFVGGSKYRLAFIHYQKDFVEKGFEDVCQKFNSKVEMKDKYNAVLDASNLSNNELGKWLREKGLHSEHLNLWKREIETMVSSPKDKEEIRKLKKHNKELEKDLKRKENALAEKAALLTLKKKAAAIWGDEEE